MSPKDPVHDPAIRHFAQRLLQSVSRSPALKAFPTKSVKRIDLARLRLAHDAAPEELIRGIVDSGGYELIFQDRGYSDPRRDDSQALFASLKTKLSREAQAAHRETGLWMLWLAYPLLYAPHPNADREDLLLAPLFLWPIRIESVGRRENHLFVARQDDAPLFNRVAANWIRRNLQFDPHEPSTTDLLGLKGIDDVARLTKKFCDTFEPPIPVEIGTRIQPVPNRKELGRGRPALLNAGIMGLVRWENMELLADLDRLRQFDRIDGPAGQMLRPVASRSVAPVLPPAEVDRYLVTPTDVFQEGAVWRARTAEGAVIHGPPGTGKSQVIVNIVADHLARGKTVLVVCQKKAALDVVSSRLKAAGLGDLILQVDDAEGDRRRVIETLRSQTEAAPESVSARAQTAARIDALEKEFESYARALFHARERWGVNYQTIISRIARIERSEPDVRPSSRIRELLLDATDEALQVLVEQVGVVRGLFVEARVWENPWAIDGQSLSGDRYECEEIDLILDRVVQRCIELDERTPESGPARAPLDGSLAKIAEACDLLARNWASVHRQLLAHEATPTKPRIDAEEFAAASGFADQIARFDDRRLRWVFPSFRRARREIRSFRSGRPWLSSDDAVTQLEALRERAKAAAAWVETASALEQWITPACIGRLHADVREARSTTSFIGRLRAFVHLLPALVRYRAAIAAMDLLGRAIVSVLIKESAEANAQWEGIVRLSALLAWAAAAESDNPILRAKTPELYESDSQRLRELSLRKKSLEKSFIRSTWAARWHGVDHRWRHGLRFKGKNSSRLREVVEGGRTRGLFDVRPCWLANPGTISQMFPLEPGVFDLVVFDEASQCPPEFAIPSLFRSKSVVVAGDGKQLPPTSFFRSSFDFDPEIDDEVSAGESAEDRTEVQLDLEVATGSEDLLSLAQARLPEAHLNVHYRSLDPALISFSNAAFYGNRLEVPTPPRPVLEGDRPALDYRSVNGVYQPSKTNPQEARAVVDYLKGLWSASAVPPTVGVVTFNEAQRDAILDLLDVEGVRDPQFRFATERELVRMDDGQDVGLFVKSLESVQGDERDIILFSTTYGRRPDGRFVKSFLGPINQQGGERRLNVAVTRARTAVRIFSSLPIDELASALTPGAVESADAAGRAMLQLYLAYAKRTCAGESDLANGVLSRALAISGSHQTASRSGKMEESEFEIEVREVLQSALGLPVHPQVSSGAFRIDLGVRAPADDCYILGIECDGKAYHSGMSARAHDHWRQGLLEERGWRIHRIWSTSWRESRQREVDKVVAVVTPILRRLAQVDATRSPDRSRSPVVREGDEQYQVSAPLDKRPIGSGDVVTYIFLDEPDRERTARLVNSEATVVDGEVRTGSPIGRALVGQFEGAQTVLALDGGRRRIIEIRAVRSA